MKISRSDFLIQGYRRPKYDDAIYLRAKTFTYQSARIIKRPGFPYQLIYTRAPCTLPSIYTNLPSSLPYNNISTIYPQQQTNNTHTHKNHASPLPHRPPPHNHHLSNGRRRLHETRRGMLLCNTRSMHLERKRIACRVRTYQVPVSCVSIFSLNYWFWAL